MGEDREVGVNGRSKTSLKEYTDYLGITSFFQRIVGGEDVKEGKPSPEPVNTILHLQDWSKNNTLVVGDMNVDILMGNRAGADTCGVTYGNGTVEEAPRTGFANMRSRLSRECLFAHRRRCQCLHRHYLTV